jgi:hypothetical protein
MLAFAQQGGCAYRVLACKNSRKENCSSVLIAMGLQSLVDLKSGADMSQNLEERRRTSFAGFLDSAMRAASRLTVHVDPAVRALANQIITDLKRIGREMPARCKFDSEVPRKTA